MNTTLYEIIRYQPRYLEDVVRLLVPLWGSDLEASKAYLHWKYLDTPYGYGPMMHLALCQGKPVGVRAFAATCWQADPTGKQQHLCVADADAVVHPDHRRQGLLKSMTNSALRDLEKHPYDYVITLGAAPQSAASNLGMGWAKAGEIKRMEWKAGLNAKTTDSSSLRKVAKKVPFLATAYRAVRDVVASPPAAAEPPNFHILDRSFASCNTQDDCVVLEKEPRPKAMSHLTAGHKDGRIRHVKDEAFIAWRYKNPRAAYRFLFWEQEELKGYVVLQQELHAHGGSASIVDWEAVDRTVFAGLVRSAIQWGGFSSLRIWSSNLAKEQVDTLLELGFQEVEGDTGQGGDPWPILIRPLGAREAYMGGRNLLEISNWDLRAIYCDSY